MSSFPCPDKCPPGVSNVAYAFPKIKIVAGAVDHEVDANFHIIPGIGNFGMICCLHAMKALLTML